MWLVIGILWLADAVMVADCSAFTGVRYKHFNVMSMAELFENVLIDNIISFIKEIKFLQPTLSIVLSLFTLTKLLWFY